MDGYSRYNKVSLKDKDQILTTFIIEWGSYSYWRMPFGLETAPTCFSQNIMIYSRISFIIHWNSIWII
jgi:hypothetical protein